MKSNLTALTENQQKLLMRLADGECDAAEKVQAEALASAGGEAARFLEDLRAAGLQSRGALQPPQLSPQLWKRVFNRIDQEERLEAFLGERRSPRLRERFVEPLLERLREFGWRMYGPAAAFAAICAVLIVRVSGSPLIGPAGQTLARGAEGMVTEVSAAGMMGSVQDGKYSPPVLLEDQAPVSIEVDWMKGRGAVKLIQGPRGGAILSVGNGRRGIARSSSAAVSRPDRSFNR